MNLSTPLEQSILRTIVYFDLFSYPLTELEIWKWQFHDRNHESGIMNQRYGLNEIVEALEKSESLNKLLDFSNGFYFLKGRGELIEERKRRYVISDHKYKRVRFWIGFLQYAPFVRAIAICNNLSYHNAKESSDIDLLVITEPDHIWTARFFLTGFLKFFRLRPDDRKNYDGLCPSFFISRNALDMDRFALENGDPYLFFWTNNIMPIAGDEKYFEKFFAVNAWIKKDLPSSLESLGHPRLILKSCLIFSLFQKIAENLFLVFPLIEKYLEAWQKKIMPSNLKKLAGEPHSGVFISGNALKFHENDRRAYFKEEFDRKLKELCF